MSRARGKVEALLGTVLAGARPGSRRRKPVHSTYPQNAATALGFVLLALILWPTCEGGQTIRPYAVYTGGNARRGRHVIDSYRCGACHTIPGVPHANGVVGPPLMFFSRRTMIAGELPNSTENLVRWIRSPQSVEPGTAMPTLGLSDQEARDVAAYLYTLQ
jgi:cytochrome c